MRRFSAQRLFRRPLKLGVFLALGTVLVSSLAFPERASADILGINLNPADLVVDGFKALLEWIFGDLEKLANNLVRLMLAVPLLTDTRQFGRLNEYREYVTAAAWGILPLSLMVSSLRYWFSGFIGNGAYEALLGFVRVAGAVAMILAFPEVFEVMSRIVNELTVALVVNPTVGEGLTKTAGPFAAFVAIGSVISSGGLAVIVVLAGVVLMMILLVVKVIVIALLAVLFSGASLAIAFWPIEELGFLLRSLLQAILGCFSFPVIWALCFGVFSILTPDMIFGTGGGSLTNGLLAPLVGLASLIVAFKLPFVVMRQAMQAGLMPSVGKGVRTIKTVQAIATISPSR